VCMQGLQKGCEECGSALCPTTYCPCCKKAGCPKLHTQPMWEVGGSCQSYVWLTTYK
jgi:hypothetical protein